ncbi:hypothetical protein SAMN04487897_12652 [Paenibacillus sp. yr247]|nr:hypothetical protein SAMN04487897_12652 [Paenibacillus sp. yr247]
MLVIHILPDYYTLNPQISDHQIVHKKLDQFEIIDLVLLCFVHRISHDKVRVYI